MITTINLKGSKNVLEETLSVYGSLDSLFRFLGLNPSYDVTDTIPANAVLQIDTNSYNPSSLPVSKTLINQTSAITQIKGNISVLDEVLSAYGSLDSLFEFLNSNPSYEVLDTILTGSQIVINPTIKKNKIAPIGVKIVQNTQINVEIQTNQTLFDLTTRYFGSLDNVLNVLLSNPEFETITNDQLDGLVLSVIPNNFNNVVGTYNSRKAVLTTGLNRIQEIIGKSFNLDFNFDFH